MTEFRILVLCTGNIGRSPLAAAMLRHHLATGLGVPVDDLDDRGVIVASAGTAAPVGQGASHRGIALAAARGLDLTQHRATPLTEQALRGADRIFCMDRTQLEVVKALAPEAMARTALLAGEGMEIPDPHFESDAFFRAVAQRIEQVTARRAAELLAEFDDSI